MINVSTFFLEQKYLGAIHHKTTRKGKRNLYSLQMISLLKLIDDLNPSFNGYKSSKKGEII
jgi:hypothetical protein